MLLRAFMYRFLSECIFTRKWIYWTICVTFLGTAKLFCKVTACVHYHQQCVRVSCSLIQNSRLSDDKLGLKRWWERWLTGSLCPRIACWTDCSAFPLLCQLPRKQPSFLPGTIAMCHQADQMPAFHGCAEHVDVTAWRFVILASWLWGDTRQPDRLGPS